MSLSQPPCCGAPPAPPELWTRWTLDPVLIGALATVAIAYAVGRRASAASPRRAAAFYLGWTILSLALVSPLRALSAALFSARVGQELLIALVAAPLIAWGGPHLAVGAPDQARDRLQGFVRDMADRPLAATLAFALTFWVWHAPGPYAATFAAAPVWWLMQLSLFGSALWLWLALLDKTPDRLGWTVLAGVLSTGQIGLLGAMLTLAKRPFYPPHVQTPYAWGLSPLDDQQLGGALLWGPGALAFLAAVLAALQPTCGRAPRAVGAGLDRTRA